MKQVLGEDTYNMAAVLTMACKCDMPVFFLNFHATRPNAHFEDTQTSNTHNSYMITEFLTCPKHDFTHLGWVDM